MLRAIPLLVTSIFSSPEAAWPQTPDLADRQWNHRVFSAMDGAPTDIAALAQTIDGTLWIGGRTGLARFDGIRFVPYPQPSDEPLGSTNVSSLFATDDGSLWIGFRPGGASLLSRGRVTHYTEQDGLPEGTVQSFAQTHDGSLWAAARTGLARFDGTRWEKVASESRLRTPYGLLVDHSGTLWVATVDGLFARAAATGHFRRVDRRAYSDPGGIILAAAPDGKVWAAADTELIRIDLPTDHQQNQVASLGEIAEPPLLFDDAGYLWAAAGTEKNLVRMAVQDLTSGAGQKRKISPGGSIGSTPGVEVVYSRSFRITRRISGSARTRVCIVLAEAM